MYFVRILLSYEPSKNEIYRRIVCKFSVTKMQKEATRPSHFLSLSFVNSFIRSLFTSVLLHMVETQREDLDYYLEQDFRPIFFFVFSFHIRFQF